MNSSQHQRRVKKKTSLRIIIEGVQSSWDQVLQAILTAVLSCLVESLTIFLTKIFFAASKFREIQIKLIGNFYHERCILHSCFTQQLDTNLKSILNLTLLLILKRRLVYFDLCESQNCDRKEFSGSW